ncbi:MAG: T9SS type A sorting domain-containing protein [Bacteroidetes bacterium]|nr:T9SS type A sorting domain-containing protein [Bacteroidota bacterium]
MKIIFLFFISVYSTTVDAQVSMAWVKTIGAPLSTTPLDHKLDAAGNLFVFGNTTDTICGYYAFFISEIDMNGNEIRQTTIATDSNCDRERPSAFSLGTGKHIFACGQLENNQFGGLLYDFDSTNLSIQWSHNIGSYYVDCVHGFSNENYVIGNYPPELQRWSETGNLAWTYAWNGQVANAFKTFRDKTDGVYMLVNTFDSVPSTMEWGFGLAKRDTSNSAGWSMVHNPPTGQIHRPIDVVQENASNTYVLSRDLSGIDSIFVTKISSSGQYLWTSRYGPCHFAYELKFDAFNNHVIALVKSNGTIKPIRFDTTGALVDTTTGTNSQVYGNPVFDVDTLGNCYVANENSISTSNYVTYTKKYNSGGGILWSNSYSSTIPLLPSHLSVQSDGSVIITLKKEYLTMQADSIVIIKLDQPLSIQESNQSQFNISLFPNPANGVFHFEMNGAGFTKSEIQIYDVLGSSVFKSKLMNPKFDVDLSEHAKGIYFYRIFNATEMIGSGKMIVE